MSLAAMRTPQFSELNAPERLDAVTAIILLLAFIFVMWRLQRSYRRKRSQKFLVKGMRAEATIIEKRKYTAGMTTATIFEFLDAKGNKNTGKWFSPGISDPSQSIATLKEGKKFTLLYNPENPREYYPEVLLQHWIKDSGIIL